MSSKVKKGKAKSARKSKIAKVAAAPTDEPVKRGKGRPTDYKPEYAEQVRKLHLLGSTDEEIAQFFGCTVQTLFNWRKKFPDFFEAERGARTFADAEVAASAFKRAAGYSYETEKIIGKGDNARVVKLTVHVPADTTAAQWWLRNRQRRNWADTKQIEVGAPGEFDAMSQDELITYIREQEEAIGLYDAEPGSDAVN